MKLRPAEHENSTLTVGLQVLDFPLGETESQAMEPFKNLINPQVVTTMGEELKTVYPPFKLQEFLKLIPNLQSLELKARVLLVTSSLKKLLPQDYPKALGLILKVIERDKLAGFQLWPFSEFIGQFGLDHFDESLKAMYVLTPKFTAEFAVRPFFLKDPAKVMKTFSKWTKDKNHHIRRFVSEGSRPLLPWGQRLPIFIIDPTHTLKFLEKLKYDQELYVRKSVANHLNDISKNHPQVVIKLMKIWEQTSPPEHLEKILWIKRHALRTLIKKGNKDALKLFGAHQKAQILVSAIKLNQKNFHSGDKLSFEMKITSTSRKSQKLLMDYLIDFMKSNGTKSSKVYKLKTLELQAGETISIVKSHHLKPITTMTYYPGLHHVSIQINGEIISTKSWHFEP